MRLEGGWPTDRPCLGLAAAGLSSCVAVAEAAAAAGRAGRGGKAFVAASTFGDALLSFGKAAATGMPELAMLTRLSSALSSLALASAAMARA